MDQSHQLALECAKTSWWCPLILCSYWHLELEPPMPPIAVGAAWAGSLPPTGASPPLLAFSCWMGPINCACVRNHHSGPAGAPGAGASKLRNWIGEGRPSYGLPYCTDR